MLVNDLISVTIHGLLTGNGGLTAVAGRDSGMSRRLSAENFTSANSGAFLIRELRESEPYLADEGWHQVARLMSGAADEIEQLQARIRQLEGASFASKPS